MRGLRSVRVWWQRARYGVDPGDLAPGIERVHRLRGRALRAAIRRGEVDADGASRTIRAPGPDDPTP